MPTPFAALRTSATDEDKMPCGKTSQTFLRLVMKARVEISSDV